MLCLFVSFCVVAVVVVVVVVVIGSATVVGIGKCYMLCRAVMVVTYTVSRVIFVLATTIFTSS